MTGCSAWSCPLICPVMWEETLLERSGRLEEICSRVNATSNLRKDLDFDLQNDCKDYQWLHTKPELLQIWKGITWYIFICICGNVSLSYGHINHYEDLKVTPLFKFSSVIASKYFFLRMIVWLRKTVNSTIERV